MNELGRTNFVRGSRVTIPPPDKGPRPLRRWLDDLVALEPLAAIEPVRQALMQLSQTRLPPEQRLALLEEFPPALAAMVGHAGRRRIGMTVPVSPQGRAMLGELGVLHGLLARAYERTADEDTGQGEVDLALVLERAMSNLIEVLSTAYEAYEPVPEGTWRALHGLYARARALGVDKRRVPDPHNPIHPYIDLSTVYRHALLLGLADPYQLPFRAVARLRGRLPEWAGACDLNVQNAVRRRRCRFVIDLESDRPGFPVLGREGALDEGRHLVLNTTRLTLSLHRTMAQLRASMWSTGRTAAVSDLELVDLLRTLIVRWGMHPIRRRTRARVAQDYEVVAGLRGISRQLAGDGGRVAETVVLEGGATPATPGTTSVAAYWQRWRSIDVSDSGWRLAVDGGTGIELRVGEVLALRGVGEGAWALGAVRWARGREEGRLEIGVQALGVDPRPAVLWQAGLDDEALRDTGSRPALYLPPEAGSGIGRLVCEPGVYRPGQLYHVRVGDEMHLIGIEDVVYGTRSFECFAFRRAYHSGA